MTTHPITTETATAPTLDTTEIPVQFPEMAPVAARTAADTFPYSGPVPVQRARMDRFEVAGSYLAVALAAAAATVLMVGGALGGLS